MKQASAELIELLANSSQLVMWEEFVFTLSDGVTQLTYTTQDPDVVVTPTGSAPGWLLDTFTGTGNLSTHVGETGAVWSVGTGGYPIGPDGFVLDGAGNVSVPAADTGQVRASGLPPADTSDFYLELHLFLDANAVISFSCTRVSGFKGFQLECSTFSGSTIAASTYGSTDAETFSNGYDTGVAFPGSAVAWVEVSGGRQVVRYGVGSARGVNQLAEYTFADALPTPDAVQMVVFGPSGLATVSRIDGDAL